MTATAFAPGVRGNPPDETDHGVNESLFPLLWSGDDDRFVNESTYYNRTGERRTPLEVIANGTDIPLDEPPEAVEDWNFGDLQEIPETNRSVSIGPAGVKRSRATVIRDAFVSIFAIQPSTSTHLRPSQRPLYVGPTGSVLALVDYRVQLLNDRQSGNVTHRSRLESHRIRDLRLYVDGERENSTRGSQTTALGYDDLADYPGREHNLTIAADIVVTVNRTKSECLGRAANGTCERWHNETRSIRATHTVSDSREVHEYRPSVVGLRTQYPTGEYGLKLRVNEPWLGFETPAGTVRGSWRFYSARDVSWDSLSIISADRTREIHSPAHPLQVHAYPIRGGPISRSGSIRILDSSGRRMDAPKLGPTINLDVANRSYTASSELVTQIEDLPGGELNGTIEGLVRGSDISLSEAKLRDVPLIETDLDLTVRSIDDGMAVVELSLREATSGEPIDTSAGVGELRIGDTPVKTDSDGVVVRKVPVGNGLIRARYEPAPWWEQTPGYTSASNAVFASQSALDIVNAVFQIGVPIGLVLLAAFLVDRITGIPIWPPWRLG